MSVPNPSPRRADGATRDAPTPYSYADRRAQLRAWMRAHLQRGDDGRSELHRLFGTAPKPPQPGKKRSGQPQAGAEQDIGPLLWQMLDATGPNGTFQLSNAQLAEHCGWGLADERAGAEKVSRLARKLEKAGWLELVQAGSGGPNAWKRKASVRRLKFLRPTLEDFHAAHPQLAPVKPAARPVDEQRDAHSERGDAHAGSRDAHTLGVSSTEVPLPVTPTDQPAGAREERSEAVPAGLGRSVEATQEGKGWAERVAARALAIAHADSPNSPPSNAGAFRAKAERVALTQLAQPFPEALQLEPEAFAAAVRESLRYGKGDPRQGCIPDAAGLVRRLTPEPPPPPAPKVDAGHVRCVACSLGSELANHPDEKGPGCSICDEAGQLPAPVPGIDPEQDPIVGRLIEALPRDRRNPWTLSSRPPRDRGGSGDNQRAWVVLRRWPGAQDLAQALWDAAAPDRVALAEQRAADRAQRAAMEQQRAAQRAAEKAAARPQPAGVRYVDCGQHGRDREDHEMPGICWQCGEAQRHSSSAA